jgi:2'-5' RNA ligase
MRVFFALVPDESVRAALGVLGRALVERIGGRAVPAHNIHLTLAFIGDVEAPRVPALCTVLGDLPRDGFMLALDRVGEWHHAGVVWTAPSVVPDALGALHARLDERLRAEEFPVETRPFRPHVTLVRRRKRPLADAPATPIDWRVERVSLMRSESIGGGVRYSEEAGVGLA